MNKVKIGIIIGILLALPFTVQAIDLGFSKTDKVASKAGYDQATETSLAETVGVVIKAAISFVGVIFLLLTVYGGYLWMTARGEEEPITKAKKIITACVIGLIIVAGSYSFTAFIVPQILGKTTGKSGGAYVPEAGASKVHCCRFCDALTCQPPKQIVEKECKALGGDYKGLVPSNECE